MTTTIWWIRRDLRLFDNQTVHKAIESGTKLVPLFIVDPFFERSDYVAERRRHFLWQSLQKLDASLKELNSQLVVRHGDPQTVLPKLVDEVKATAVYTEADFSTYARCRDSALKESMPLKLISSLTYHHPDDVLKDDGDAYVVYTPYKKKWLERPLPRKQSLLEVPDELPPLPDIQSEELPEGEASEQFPAGEAEARRRLEEFASGPIFEYKQQRDAPAIDGTSQLSPYLRFGMVSARNAIATAVAARAQAKGDDATKSVQTWLEELIWREFYISILYHHPRVAKGNFRKDYDSLKWEQDEALFEAWTEGKTGYPIVDAAMRQINELGWMHNRVRMIVASFLVKDLLINWQRGEKYFMQKLVDGDPAANNGGWQWSAGTGTDAAPYFRIFNPTTQGEKHDSDGDYIRRFVPELKNFTDKEIHQPHKVSKERQEEAGCIIGEDYPEPIVDHKAARERTLEAYKSAKSN